MAPPEPDREVKPDPPTPSSWQAPALAALSVGVPLGVGALAGHPPAGMVAAGGAMTILYLPRTFRSQGELAAKLIRRSLGMTACFAAGAAASFAPWPSLGSLVLVTLLAVLLCRRFAVPPPGSFFFVLTAAVASHPPFVAAQLPLKLGLFALGATFSSLIAFAYLSRVGSRERPGRAAPDPNLPALLVESAIIALFVGLSVWVARALQIDSPYWAAISCIAILQGATFRSVWSRHIHRSLGTAVGIGLCWMLFPPSADPRALALILATLVFVVELLVPRHYGLAAVFITPLAVGFAELASGGAPIRELLWARLLETALGGAIGALGGSVVHHRRFCLRAEALVARLLGRPPVS